MPSLLRLLRRPFPRLRALAPASSIARAAAATFFGSLGLGVGIALAEERKSSRVVVGTYTERLGHVDGKGRGMYVFRVDEATGSLSYEHCIPDERNPTYMCVSASGETMYVVDETYGQDGCICAYTISSDSKTLTKCNEVSALGQGTCHISTTKDGKFLAVANYEGGERGADRSLRSVAVYAVERDGSIGRLADEVVHKGPGTNVNTGRQGDPHAHMALIAELSDNDQSAILVPDLGKDDIIQYKLSSKTGKLSPLNPTPYPSAAKQREGAGPRHMAIHPNGRFLYVLNELDSTLCLHTFCKDSGRLGTVVQRVNTAPEGFGKGYTGKFDDSISTTAAIKFHPQGRFVYVSNRVVGGEGILSCFDTDEKSGRLQARSYHGSGGVTPRDFMFLPGGEMMLCLNQDSDNVVSFRVNASDGSLTPTGHVAHCPSPVCAVGISVAEAS